MSYFGSIIINNFDSAKNLIANFDSRANATIFDSQGKNPAKASKDMYIGGTLFNKGSVLNFKSVTDLFDADFNNRGETEAKYFLKQIKVASDNEKDNFKKNQLLKYYNYGIKYLKAVKAADRACKEAETKATEEYNKATALMEDPPEIDKKKLQKLCEEASNKAFNDVMAGADPARGNGGDKKPSGPRQVVSARLSEQAALMVNLQTLLKKEFLGVNRTNIKYKNFSVVRTKEPGHNKVTSRFTKQEDMGYFFDKLPTNVISMLVPSIKIYKIFYPDLHDLAKEKIDKKNVDEKFNAALKKSHHWRVPFDDTPVKYGKQTSDFAASSIEEVLNGNGSLHTVGIKSFNYEFSGNNPASARAVVKASIKIFFQNPADLVKEYPIQIQSPNSSEKINYTFSYSDLMNWSNRNNLAGPDANQPNEHYYRIKVVCGYGSIDEGLVEQHLSASRFTEEEIKKIIDIIKSTTIVMFLSPFSYDVAFQENGSTELTINYHGQTETVMTTKEADIFYSTEAAQKSIKLQSLLQKAISKKDNEKNEKKNPTKQEICDEKILDEQIKELSKELKIKPNKIDIEKIKKQIINLKKESYNAVFKKLIGFGGGKIKEPQTHKSSGVYSVYIKTGLIQAISSEKSTDGKRTIRLGSDTDVKMLRLENVNYKSALIRHTIPKAKKGESLSGNADLQKVAEQQAKAINDKKAEQTKIGGIEYTKIRFFFLGDILDAAMDCLRNVQPISDRPRIIIGEMPLIIPTELNANLKTIQRFTRKRDFYSLADIPISFDLFQQFFLEKIVATERERYPILELVKDVISELIIPAVAPNVLDDNSGFNSKLNYSTLNITTPAPGGSDLLLGEYNKSNKIYNLKNIHEEDSYNGTIIDDEILNQIDKKRVNAIQITNIDDTVNYMFIYCSSLMPFVDGKEMTPYEIEKADISNGVYHAKMGTDSGIVKKISFKKSDLPYQREMIARNNGKNLGTSIKQVFNADVTLFGNNIYYPGDYLYINPIYALNQGGFVDLQETLGIGGYYMVIKVNTSVSESGFETKLECIYQAGLKTMKGGKVKREELYNDDNCGLIAK